jgi:2-phospho-L-lactate guanylyltransferase
MRTAAILPVKRFAQAKRRLGASVAGELRDDLARAMVGDVLAALAETASIERTIVVTGEPSVAATARAQGAIVIDDTAQRGQSAAVALGVERALAEGMERVLCIPGDCPTLDPAELTELLGAPADGLSSDRPVAGATAVADQRHTGNAGPQVVIVPDRHGTGTNGLLLAPPDIMTPSFGPDSCERHRALARAAGVVCHIARAASLLLDIDTGEDLTALRARLIGDQPSGGRYVRASRTRAVLDQTARQGRLVTTTSA